ncbi:hypothetical protein MMC29_001287 [Sticta canariensis]|nr:hypothetical protein [Sticta canariensis]
MPLLDIAAELVAHSLNGKVDELQLLLLSSEAKRAINHRPGPLYAAPLVAAVLSGNEAAVLLDNGADRTLAWDWKRTRAKQTLTPLLQKLQVCDQNRDSLTGPVPRELAVWMLRPQLLRLLVPQQQPAPSERSMLGETLLDIDPDSNLSAQVAMLDAILQAERYSLQRRLYAVANLCSYDNVRLARVLLQQHCPLNADHEGAMSPLTLNHMLTGLCRPLTEDKLQQLLALFRERYTGQVTATPSRHRLELLFCIL